MKITICGSMAFAKEMLNIKKALEQKGHLVYIPEETVGYTNNPHLINTAEDRYAEVGASRKIQHDLIKKHYRKIENSDAILVLNYDRRGIKNYIGGNSFLEMGFAHVLNKSIYLMQDVPHEMNFLLEEIKAMQPIILNRDLSKLA